MTNGQEHRNYRTVLNPRFSPKVVKGLEDSVRQDCIDVIESIQAQGSLDFVTDFAMEFPTRVFLKIVQLPAEHTEMFMGWVEAIFGGLGNPQGEAAMNDAFAAVRQYFTELMESRRAQPVDDFFGQLLTSNIGDRPIEDEEFLNMGLVLLLAGLDTVKSQLGYIFHHLATSPEHRQRILDDPAVIPNAVEEYLRAYAIVMDGRKLAQDVEFHGCPMKEGDMVMLTLASASRDTTAFENAEVIDFDRQAVTHFSFGSGPHRCLGSHLARLELVTAVQEWHKRIPHYQVDPAVDRSEIVESGPQLGLNKLPLVWDVPGGSL